MPEQSEPINVRIRETLTLSEFIARSNEAAIKDEMPVIPVKLGGEIFNVNLGDVTKIMPDGTTVSLVEKIDGSGGFAIFNYPEKSESDKAIK